MHTTWRTSELICRPHVDGAGDSWSGKIDSSFFHAVGMVQTVFKQAQIALEMVTNEVLFFSSFGAMVAGRSVPTGFHRSQPPLEAFYRFHLQVLMARRGPHGIADGAKAFLPVV